MLIGVCGKKRHGKDSIGNALKKQGFNQIAFADEIKRICMNLYGFTWEQVFGGLKETIDPRWGFTPRFAMQQMGTQVGRSIHLETWVRFVLSQVQRGEAIVPDHESESWVRVTGSDWVITDVRFVNEAEDIWGSKIEGPIAIWKVFRPGVVSDDTHDSEAYIDHIIEDTLFVNDSDLDALESKVVEELAKLRG